MNNDPRLSENWRTWGHNGCHSRERLEGRHRRRCDPNSSCTAIFDFRSSSNVVPSQVRSWRRNTKHHGTPNTHIMEHPTHILWSTQHTTPWSTQHTYYGTPNTQHHGAPNTHIMEHPTHNTICRTSGWLVFPQHGSGEDGDSMEKDGDTQGWKSQ